MKNKTPVYLVLGTALAFVVAVYIAPAMAQDSGTPSSDEIIEKLQDTEGMSFRGLVIVPPEAPADVSTDDQGNTVVTDDKGNIFVTDDKGKTVLTDTEGNTITKDDEGNTIVTDVEGNETVIASPSIDMKVTFQFNSDELTEDAEGILNNLGIALMSDQLKDARFLIAGHTDAVGSQDYNQKLSERRANTVREYLMRKFDIRYSRLDTVGRGEEQLLMPGDPESGANRRVQIVNVGS